MKLIIMKILLYYYQYLDNVSFFNIQRINPNFIFAFDNFVQRLWDLRILDFYLNIISQFDERHCTTFEWRFLLKDEHTKIKDISKIVPIKFQI